MWIIAFKVLVCWGSRYECVEVVARCRENYFVIEDKKIVINACIGESEAAKIKV